MAKTRVYGFNEEGFRRVQEAVKQVLRTPTKGSQRRRQPPVITGESSNAYFVKFTIASYDEYTGGFWCTVRYRLCGSSIPGITDDGEILVYDVDGCLFDDEETTDLIGRKGDAVYMSPEESIDPYGECIWVVTGLCCPE